MNDVIDFREHWDKVYRQNRADQLSWYEPVPTRSLQWIRALALSEDAAILDVGGGISTLVDNLLDDGFERVHVLDISNAALAYSQQRLADRGALVTWHCTDVLQFETDQRFDLWHDRAVLHFINEPDKQEQYVGKLRNLLTPGAQVILAPFALDGPEQCSALRVTRYSPESLSELLGDSFELQEQLHTIHNTPLGSQQAFLFARYRYTPR